MTARTHRDFTEQIQEVTYELPYCLTQNAKVKIYENPFCEMLKELEPRERTAQEVSFQWKDFNILTNQAKQWHKPE